MSVSACNSTRLGGPCFYARLGAPAFLVQRGDAAEARADAVDEILMYGMLRLGQTVVSELKLACRPDESHSPEVGEMPRNRGLREAEDVDDIANAELPRDEQAQDSDARRIGEALEHAVEIVDRRRGDCRSHQLTSPFV